MYGLAALLIGGAIYKQSTLFTFKQKKLILKKKNELDTLKIQHQKARQSVDSIDIDSLGRVLEQELTRPNTYEKPIGVQSRNH